jgi:sugar phosphate isomerase/epimerase
LLKGDVNFKRIVPALKKAGFDGYLTAEVWKSDANMSFEDYYREVAEAAAKIIACDF